MISAFKKYWQNYVKFGGRTRRKDYWLAVLCLGICGAIVGAIANIGATTVTDPTTGLQTLQQTAIGSAISSVWGLATIVPSLSLEFRRLHDTGKRGWYLLWNLLPIIGQIIIFIALVKGGDTGANKYGEDPKQAAIEA